MPPQQTFYQSPAGSGSNDGALPKAYIVNWNAFANLSSAQIAAFESFPQDLQIYASTRRWIYEISAVPSDGKGPKFPYIALPTSAGNPNIAGMQLATDYVSQQKIAGVRQAIDNGTLTLPAGATFPFSAVNGVFNLTASDMEVLYGFVVRWVQQTYAVYGALMAQINATPPGITTRAVIDTAYAAMTVQ